LQLAIPDEGEKSAVRPLKERSYYQQVWLRVRRSPNAILGGSVLLILIVLALLADRIAPFDPLEMRVGAPFEAPNAIHWMGTDNFGRDVLSRVLFGARISLVVGFLAVLISLTAGTLSGLVAGFYGGWWERIIMRVIDAMLAFPGILLALAIVATLGSSLVNVMIAVGIAAIPTYTRVVRSTVLSSKSELYVLAARCVGVQTPTLIRRHILPNILAPIIVLSTVSIGTAIISAASLGYLGLGAQPPTPEWGLILNQGRSYLRQAWWISTFPGLTIMATVFAINILGDGLRDAIDPRMGD
jgi:peptide/nickel transport system permease protein